MRRSPAGGHIGHVKIGLGIDTPIKLQRSLGPQRDLVLDQRFHRGKPGAGGQQNRVHIVIFRQVELAIRQLDGQ